MRIKTMYHVRSKMRNKMHHVRSKMRNEMYHVRSKMRSKTHHALSVAARDIRLDDWDALKTSGASGI